MLRHPLPAKSRPEGGFLTIQYLLAVALTFVLLAQLTNLLVYAYGRGAVRAALDEGVRAASVAGGAVEQCEQRAAAVFGDLLGGSMGGGVGAVTCAVDTERVSATVEATFAAWVPGVPDYTFTTRALMVREEAS